ncbi:uncharacterized protein LOC131316832 [Rhododendron vialii]|uniref:uncharacterized protein LOC131316832 n=1 Tax=Rhododendron vialii TaxID=182163 RepID=UPI00265EE39A|nr:uncharacterized protein LOC131316832 [Rhododendron vialii]XP_058202277.1 uncharacterized protein LOC131316832 [Rhododendron vialii]
MSTATQPRPPRLHLLLFTLSLLTTPQPSHSLSYTQLQTLHSLALSLTTRVANLRASRGDLAGSDRARLIVRKLESGMGMGLGFWAASWSLGWDYVRNYAWRDAASFDLLGVVSDANELLSSLNDLSQMESEAQRVDWVMRNYRSALRVSKSLFHRLLKVFSQSGPLRKVVETVQREVVEGDLLRDCLELGSNDLKGLIQVFKDIALQYSSTSGRSDL